MKKIIIADEFGTIIVERLLKDGESPAQVFKEEEEKYNLKNQPKWQSKQIS